MMTEYDIVTVGGGVGASALAKVMAERGYRVLMLERQSEFRDRVRGEFIFPWGVAEARELGIYDALIAAGGHHPTFWIDYAGPEPLQPRDFAEDTPQKLRGLCIYHPAMQEGLVSAACAAGAEVRRGVRVRHVSPGRQPAVVAEGEAGRTTISARLVVGADGRSSMVRRWGGFESLTVATGNHFTGVLVENVPATDASSICMINPSLSRMVLYFPQTRSSGRAYLASRSDACPLEGRLTFGSFLVECTSSGLAAGVLDGSRQAGPLATFQGAESRVENPYHEGIALIGDAAATSDPTWGQGLSLTLRDVRTLRDALLYDNDWDAAGRAYASAHGPYHEMVATATSWFTRIMLQPGPESDALRSRVLPQMESDPFILPDTIVAGPDLAPATEEHRARIFG